MEINIITALLSFLFEILAVWRTSYPLLLSLSPNFVSTLVEFLSTGVNFVPLMDALSLWGAKLGIPTSMFLGQTMDVRLSLQLLEMFVEDVGVLWVTASAECHEVLARNFYHLKKRLTVSFSQFPTFLLKLCTNSVPKLCLLGTRMFALP